VLLDCQIQNDHLARLGAIEIPESQYLRRLEHALALERSFV
jgi:leucyl/phenylalanyl-tRNA--protein transferase